MSTSLYCLYCILTLETWQCLLPVSPSRSDIVAVDRVTAVTSGMTIRDPHWQTSCSCSRLFALHTLVRFRHHPEPASSNIRIKATCFIIFKIQDLPLGCGCQVWDLSAPASPPPMTSAQAGLLQPHQPFQPCHRAFAPTGILLSPPPPVLSTWDSCSSP